MTDSSQPAPEDHRGSRSQDNRPDRATEAFLAHRNLPFTATYELLGSAADAEDVLQETWLRWVERRSPGPRLTTPDVAEDVELAESFSMAMLLVLETLTPTERAVFRLREVFELGYDEIAEAVDKSPAAVRQIAHRARTHVAAHRPRGVVSQAETRDALGAFQRAVETGDLQSLVDILAPDVVLLSDGGGVKQALVWPVVGADRVARLLAVGIPGLVGAVSVEPSLAARR